MFTAGRPVLELRPRYNRIDQSDKDERTEGYTYRAVVGWVTAPWNDLRFVAEVIHTDHIGPKEFNDDGSQNGVSEYPLLPDPRYTGANRLFVEYGGLESTRIRVGRQLVRLNNQRWVSDNDFRQIPQLFDGVSAVNTSLPDTELTAAFYRRVRTTSGDANLLKLTIVNAAYNPLPGHALAAYGVWHDQPQNGAFTGFANNSYRVIGARAEGAFPAGAGIEVPYTLEFAQQKSFAGGDSRIDAHYWRAGAGVIWQGLTVRYDEELKGSNNGTFGLINPLTDFYGFNGWTLHFFNTPRQGLHDRWITARYAFLSHFVLFAEGHRFRSDFGDLDFGHETDIGLTWSLDKWGTLRFQHARYEPGIPPQVHKTWITYTYQF